MGGGCETESASGEQALVGVRRGGEGKNRKEGEQREMEEGRSLGNSVQSSEIFGPAWR